MEKSANKKMPLAVTVAIVAASAVIIGTVIMAGIAMVKTLKPATYVPDSYDRQELIEFLGSEFGCELLLFPDDVSQAAEVHIDSVIEKETGDLSGYVLLRCTYEPSDYDSEIERLAGTYFTLQSGDELLRHDVMTDAASYRLPAYVAVDGYDSVYEYALYSDDECTIDYVLLLSPGEGMCDPVRFDMKVDESVYETYESDGEMDGRFSMYVWHFPA